MVTVLFRTYHWDQQTVQDQVGEDEPAPPPDTIMLTEEEPQASAAATATVPAQQAASQAQHPPAAPQPIIQSNVFAAALAQAMGALTQQQGMLGNPCMHL